MNKNYLKEQLSKLTLVYVEDDDEIRSYIEEFFIRYVKNIYCAKDAERGLELYKEYNPDLMIIDINLPNMNGIDLIKIIRESDTQTRLVISTAYTNTEFTLEAIELKLTRYLVKPITIDDLFNMLEKVIKELEDINLSFSNIDLGNNFYFNLKTNKLMQENEEILLRKKELELLQFFVSKKESVVPYESLENEIWFDTPMTQDAIRSQIKNIRQKTYPQIFKNVSGVGYKLGIS